MTTYSPELTVHWWPVFVGDVGAYHYMLIYRMRLISALQCRLVLCFLILEGEMVFHIGLPGALYGALALLARVFGFVVMGGIVWDLRGRQHYGYAQLRFYCRQHFFSVLYLGTCPEMFISKFFWGTDLYIWLVLGGVMLASGYIFALSIFPYQRTGWKNLRNIWKLVSDDFPESACTYHV